MELRKKHTSIFAPINIRMPWSVHFETTTVSSNGITELDDISMNVDNESGEFIIFLGNLKELSDEQFNNGDEVYNEVTINEDLIIEFYKNKLSINIGLNMFDIKGIEYEIQNIYNFIKTMHSIQTVPNDYIGETLRDDGEFRTVKSKPFYLHAPHETGNIGGTGGARKKRTRKSKKSRRFPSVQTSYSRRRSRGIHPRDGVVAP